jgi:hypothetical protein
MPEIENIKPMRRKYWSELTDSERVLKLQEELSRTQHQVADLCKYVGKLMEHAHYEGRIVSNIQRPNEESYGGIYFRVEDFKDK